MPTSVNELPDIDQFYHAYGKALAQWAAVEFRLCAWFERAAGLTIGRAEAIFFSGRSFQTRSEMLGKALECGKLDEPWKRFALDALTKAIAYDSFRNHIAHGQLQPESYRQSDPDRWRLRKPHRWRKSGGVGRQNLENAATNFEALAEILSDGTWLEAKGNQPSAEFLQRLATLPNEADSKLPSQKQLGRARQQKAALRSKSRPQ